MIVVAVVVDEMIVVVVGVVDGIIVVAVVVDEMIVVVVGVVDEVMVVVVVVDEVIAVVVVVDEMMLVVVVVDEMITVVRPRSRVTTAEENQQIVLLADGEGALKNAMEIKRRLQLDASVTTIRKRLHDAGIHCRVPAKKEFLTEAHRAIRLQFARLHEHRGLDFWSNVFVDEKTFRSSDHGQVRVWGRNNTSYDV
ncbi:Transposable element Tcb2 transposase [Portunus trituberculatus]|uniref:Transposable element Tcb2 transposase n=1 Tax=Portunus trituberculatus TaxID=210409 RepID=A0A5B7K575_PORTR|nr:Transposable element Tcb2 transposase [Portunus trituberculatus]